LLYQNFTETTSSENFTIPQLTIPQVRQNKKTNRHNTIKSPHGFNEKLSLSFIYFPGNPDRINHFFYVLLRMYPLFITRRNSHTVSEYITGTPRPDTRCDAGSDPASVTFLTRNIHGDVIPGHRIPDNLVVTTRMFRIYRWDVRRGYSHRTG